VWVKELDKKKASGRWSINRITVDCGANTLLLESMTTYGADGTVIASHEVGGSPSAIVPGSTGEWLSKLLCR
jgi:hypothetical protein